MARYDNNLNDISDQIISDEEKKTTMLRYITSGLTIGIILLAVLYLSELYGHHKDNRLHAEQVDELQCLLDDAVTNCDRYDISLDDSTLYYWAVSHRVQHPDLFCASVILESGAGKSRLAIEDRNLTGMRTCKRRFTTQVGNTNSGYGIYDSWRECLIDKAYWEHANIPDSASRETYKKIYCRTYAEDTRYCQKMEKVSHRFDRFKTQEQ